MVLNNQCNRSFVSNNKMPGITKTSLNIKSSKINKFTRRPRPIITFKNLPQFKNHAITTTSHIKSIFPLIFKLTTTTTSTHSIIHQFKDKLIIKASSSSNNNQQQDNTVNTTSTGGSSTGMKKEKKLNDFETLLQELITSNENNLTEIDPQWLDNVKEQGKFLNDEVQKLRKSVEDKTTRLRNAKKHLSDVTRELSSTKELYAVTQAELDLRSR